MTAPLRGSGIGVIEVAAGRKRRRSCSLGRSCGPKVVFDQAVSTLEIALPLGIGLDAGIISMRVVSTDSVSPPLRPIIDAPCLADKTGSRGAVNRSRRGVFRYGVAGRFPIPFLLVKEFSIMEQVVLFDPRIMHVQGFVA